MSVTDTYPHYVQILFYEMENFNKNIRRNKMKYAEYLRKVEKLNESQIDKRMRSADFESYSVYLRHCRENELEKEPYEDVFWADKW